VSRLLLLATRAPLEQAFHSLLNRRDLDLQLFATYLPTSQLVPEFEYFLYFFQ
jgi:hypothetical protein